MKRNSPFNIIGEAFFVMSTTLIANKLLREFASITGRTIGGVHVQDSP